MSELPHEQPQLPFDAAEQPQFDPAAEAAKYVDYDQNFDERANFQQEWLGMGSDATPEDIAQAARDTVDYFNSRPQNQEEADALNQANHERANREYDESMPAGHNEKSIKELLTEQAQAELDDDRTRANDIQEEINNRVMRTGTKRDEKYDQASMPALENEAHRLNALLSQKDRIKAKLAAGPEEEPAEPAPAEPEVAEEPDVEPEEPTEEAEEAAEEGPDTSRIDNMSDDEIRDLDPSQMAGMTEDERNAYFARMHQLRGEDHMNAPRQERDVRAIADGHLPDDAPELPQPPQPRRRLGRIALGRRPAVVVGEAGDHEELPEVDRGEHTDYDARGEGVPGAFSNWWNNFGRNSRERGPSIVRGTFSKETYTKKLPEALKKAGVYLGVWAVEGEVERPEGARAPEAEPAHQQPARPVRPARPRRGERPAAAPVRPETGNASLRELLDEESEQF